MTSIKARLAHLILRRPTARRIVIAASTLTFSGLVAGGAAVAVVHASGPATTAPTATTSATPAPSSSAGAKGGNRPALALALVRATSRETGIAPTTIRQDLKSGQTFDQIAGDKASAVESDVLTVLQSRLDKQVSAGKITHDQETNRLNAAKTKLATAMSKPLAAHARPGSSTSG